MKCYINGPASKVIIARKECRSNTHNTPSRGKSEARKRAPRKRG